MQGRSRVTQLAVALVVAVSSLVIGPAAYPGQVAVASPADLCGLLTPDEIATALKVDAVDGSGGEGSCSWYTGGTELDVLVDTGSLEATSSGTAPGTYTDITVAGLPALIANDGDTWVVVAIDGGTLSLHLFSDPGTGVDVPAAVEALGAIAIGRMAGLGVGAPTPVPAATPGPVCGILTADEVSAALTEQVTVIESQQATDCDYLVDTVGGASVSLSQDTTSLAEFKISPFIKGTDVVVAGRPGLVVTGNPTIYVETPAGWVLEMHLFSSAVDNDAAVAALQTLAVAALGRSADFPLLIETPAPLPTEAADADLAALFPTSVGGQPFPVRALSDDELGPFYEVAASIGMGLEDLTFATASNGVASVMAVRTNTSPALEEEESFLGPLAGDMADPQQTPGVIADRAVFTVTDGPATGASSGLTIATSDDVIWAITADEPALTEILQALPLPPLPPPSPEASPAS